MRLSLSTPIKGLGKSVAATGLVNAVSMLLGLVSGVLTARGLEPGDRGELVSLLVWGAAVGSFTLIGLDEAIIFEAGGSEPRAWALRKILTGDAILQTVVGTAVLVGMAIQIVRPSTAETWATVLLVGLIVPLNSVNLLGVAPLKAARRLTIWNTVRMTQPLVYAIGAALLLASGQLTVFYGVLAMVIGSALTSAVLVFIGYGKADPETSAEDRRSVVSYGRRLVVSTLPQRVSVRADQLLMSLLMSPALLGIYSVAAAIAAVVQILGVTLDQVLFPRFVARRHSTRSILLVAGTGVGVALVASLLLLAIARPAISLLYGEAYVEAVDPLTLLLLGSVLRVGGLALAAALKAREELQMLMIAQFGGLIMLVIVFVAARPWGMMGAALATFAGATTTAVVLLSTVISRNYEQRESPT
ncbi:lipopolysaccharide biosynthesis protein [Nocardioides sp. HB32]